MTGHETGRRGVRERIIDATVALVAEKGLGNVTMTEIAERADVARQTLYNRYPDVEQVMIAAVEEYEQSGFAHLVGLVDATGSAEGKIDLLARHAVAAPDHGHGVTEVASALSPEGRARLDQHQVTFRRLIASIISFGIDEGVFDPSIDPERHAVLVQGVLLSASDLSAAEDDPVELSSVVARSILGLLGAS